LFRKSRYFTRLLFFCLAIGTFPVVFIGAFSYAKASSLIQSKVNAGNQQILQQTQSRIEHELKTVDHMTVQLMNSALVNSLLAHDLTPTDYVKVQEVLKSMYLLQTFDFGIYNIVLANFDYNWLVHKDGLYRLSDHELGTDLREYAKLKLSSSWLHDSDYMILVKKWSPNTERPAGLIALQIPQYDLKQLIAGSPNLGNFVIADRERQVVAQYQPEVGEELHTSAYMEKIQNSGQSQGYFSITTNGREEEVVFRQSDYNGWVYMSVTARSELTKEAKSIGWLTLWVCLALLALTLVGSLLGTRRMYSPVRRLVDAVQTDGQAQHVRSFADEFHYVAEEIRLLLRTRSEMQEDVHTYMRQWESLFLIRLLRGELRKKEIEEHWRRFSYPERGHYVVLALHIDTLDNTRYLKQDIGLLLYAVNNVAGELIPRESRLTPIVMDHFQVSVISSLENSPKVMKAEAYRWADKLQEVIKSILGLSVSVGISQACGHPHLVAAAYTEATEVLKYRFRLGEALIIHTEDVEAGGEGFTEKMVYPVQTAADLCDAVRSGDVERVEELLRETLELLTHSRLTPQQFQMMLVRLLFELLRLVPDQNELANGSSGEKALVEQLTRLQRTVDIEHWFLQTAIRPIMEYLESKREFQYERISSQIKQLVHERYDADFSLEICADELGYHSSYIKRVFRKGAGTSFSEYLAQYRMKMAKKLLAETDDKISEIAERIRYNNTQNFIRQFRKVEGITPGQYRKLHGGSHLPEE
jgi:two-component system response regulator YesN